MDLANNQPLTAAQIEQVKAITNTGKLYYDYSDLIERARNWAYLVCRTYNAANLNYPAKTPTQSPTTPLAVPDKAAAKKALEQLLGAWGQNTTIAAKFICEFGFNLFLGANVVIKAGVSVIDCNEITIGAGTIIGENCGIYTSNHAFDATARKNHYCFELPISVGKNCRIGANCVLCPGSSVPDNTIIQPGSVVVGNLPESGVYAGVPAKKISSN